MSVRDPAAAGTAVALTRRCTLCAHLIERQEMKENLQIERPTLHVLVEIVEVGVVVHLFKVGGVAVVLGQQRGQRGLS